MSTKERLNTAAHLLSEIMNDESARLTIPMIQLFTEAQRDIEKVGLHLGVEVTR